MPNIKSAKKRVIVNALRNERNRATKTALKTKIKKFESALSEGVGADESFKAAVISIDKAAGKGVMHKNTAARRKSKLARKLNAAK